MVQPDVAQLVTEDEPQPVPVAVVQVGEQLIGQHDIVVAGCLGGEGVQGPVAVGEEDLRASPQPQSVGEVLGGLVQLGVLAL
jgi:hypothetical protein